MNYPDLGNIPFMLYADSSGQVFEHPYYRMVGFSGATPLIVRDEELIPVPEFSKLFFIPDCPPIGLDPSTGQHRVVPQVEIDGASIRCNAVAAFLVPGLVRSLLPAVNYESKSYTLPTWAYTAVGFRDDRYWAAGFRIEYNHRWDPRNYDDRELIPAIERYQKEHPSSPLIEHLIYCATHNHCFAAKNLFLQRWEAPLPVSQQCNAACLGCLSMQNDLSCPASHHRILFRPSQDELVHIAVEHLRQAPEAIVSFGQGCEAEPLTEYKLIAQSIKEIREKTDRGTINLNTNGSWPERIRLMVESGLDSIRISLNSARSEFYQAYYRPRNYDFDDVVTSISLSKNLGLYTMINYLVFPGITDQVEEIDALIGLIQKTGVNFLHLKNLNIDPQLYLDRMPEADSPAVGMKKMVGILEEEFPNLALGYFNQPVR
ncbi:MAG: radical SAM protein [Deltaproteobacteria bacterium]|nr:MAG: radical SAM protein [Deltaproteobacteria bacterium]